MSRTNMSPLLYVRTSLHTSIYYSLTPYVPTRLPVPAEEACPSAPEQSDNCVKDSERLPEPDISLTSTGKRRRRRAKVVDLGSETAEEPTPPSDIAPKPRRKRRTAPQLSEGAISSCNMCDRSSDGYCRLVPGTSEYSSRYGGFG